MQKRLGVSLLALGIALSGSAFGQSWTKSTQTNPQSQTNAYNPNTYDQQKARTEADRNHQQAQRQPDKSPSKNAARAGKNNGGAPPP
jgi:hypothetical protein